jgi:mannose-6-phosphate isomerase-like protein (cupin superfamily)
MAELFEMSKLMEWRASIAKPYLEFLRVPALSAGIYVLPAGAEDQQRPHAQDEVYYVVRGQARFSGTDDLEVRAGSVIFVPANKEHRFHSITEELVLLVLFAPAESQ